MFPLFFFSLTWENAVLSLKPSRSEKSTPLSLSLSFFLALYDYVQIRPKPTVFRFLYSSSFAPWSSISRVLGSYMRRLLRCRRHRRLLPSVTIRSAANWSRSTRERHGDSGTESLLSSAIDARKPKSIFLSVLLHFQMVQWLFASLQFAASFDVRLSLIDRVGIPV